MALRDGRQLAWREYGAAKGYPVLFMHGNFNSRLLQPAWSDTSKISEEANARVIAVDRPGYGQSDFSPNRTYSSWAEDVEELASHLDLDQIGVLGYSSGGPNALVCACKLPHLVSVCGLLSSDGPYTKMAPDIVQGMYGTSAPLSWEECTERKESVLHEMKEQYQGVSNAEKRQFLLWDLEEAITQGLNGAIQDNVLETSDWGFCLSDLNSVESAIQYIVWHGDADHDVPFEVGKYLAENLPAKHTTTRFIEGENHALLRRHWQEILKTLVEQGQEQQ